MTDLPMSFKWNLDVHIQSAHVDIEVNYECVTVEVNDFDADTCVTFNKELLAECLDMDDLYTLRRICVAVIEERERQAREE